MRIYNYRPVYGLKAVIGTVQQSRIINFWPISAVLRAVLLFRSPDVYEGRCHDKGVFAKERRRYYVLLILIHSKSKGFMTQAVDHSRRAFLRRAALSVDKRQRVNTLRPPWSLGEEQDAEQFVDHCVRCHDCISVCETGLLIKGDGGFPEADFTQGECTFCGDCVRSCEHGALRFSPLSLPEESTETSSKPWSIKAQIQDNCLSLNGVDCRCCGEHCEQEAITFHFVVTGTGGSFSDKATAMAVAQPAMNTDQCTGCGACVAVCPVASISMQVPLEERL